jgi:hypothetical protein
VKERVPSIGLEGYNLTLWVTGKTSRRLGEALLEMDGPGSIWRRGLSVGFCRVIPTSLPRSAVVRLEAG